MNTRAAMRQRMADSKPARLLAGMLFARICTHPEKSRILSIGLHFEATERYSNTERNREVPKKFASVDQRSHNPGRYAFSRLTDSIKGSGALRVRLCKLELSVDAGKKLRVRAPRSRKSRSAFNIVQVVRHAGKTQTNPARYFTNRNR